jgi:hypothetical protein
VIDQLTAVTSYVAAGLLAASGAVKLIRPAPTAGAMYAAGLPGSRVLARGIGAMELLTGIWFLAAPSLASGLTMAALYLVFAGFVTFLVTSRPQASSCGCAGAKDVPPSWIHVALNLVAAGAAFAAAVRPPAGLPRALTDLGFAAIPYAVGLVAAAGLAAVAVTDLPAALGAFHRPSGHPAEPDRDRHARADGALASAGVGPGHASLWPGADPAEIDTGTGPGQEPSRG